MDNKEDLSLDFWAGEITVKQSYGYPVATDNLRADIEIPQHILDFYEKRK